MAAPWRSAVGLSEAVINDTDFINVCPEIAIDVKSRTVELVTLVERLGSVLTDVNPNIRERGTLVLAHVLRNLPEDFLTESELQFISTFFCDRLNDHHSVVPAALRGISAIAGMKNLANKDACRVLLAMFRHVHCQSQMQPDRQVFYQIIRTIMYRATKELQELGPDFVFGVISAMDGERDPRNLMLLFHTLPELLSLFPPGHLTEDMFEVIACYFPVDFHSTSADGQSVTRDDLANALVPCMTARPEFAEFCLPLLLEKLDSSLRIAKTDSLAMLTTACDRFPLAALERHLIDIWGQLKCALLPGLDSKLTELSVAVLQALIHKLSIDFSQQLDKLLDFIMAAGRDALRYADMGMFAPAVRLLVSSAQASPSSCRYILNQAVPLLVTQCSQELPHEQKALVLGTITSLLSTSVQHSVLPDSPTTLLHAFLSAGEHPTLRMERLRGTAQLVHSLEPQSRTVLYPLLCEWTHTEEDAKIRDELAQCFKSAAECHPDEILEQVVNTRLSLETPHNLGDAILARRVEMLCCLAILEPFTETVAPQVLRLVTEATTFGQCHAGLQGLKKLVTDGSVKVHAYLHHQCAFLLRLGFWWLQGVQRGRNPEIFDNLALLQDTAHILYCILRTLPASTQSDVIAEMMPWYFHWPPCPSSFHPLSATSPIAHTRSVLLLQGAVGALRREVDIQPLQDLCHRLTQLTTHSPDPATQLGAAQLLAVVVNKAPDLTLVDKLLEDLCTDASCPPLVATWLTKALLLRGHSSSSVWMATLITLLGSAESGTVAAQGFLTLLDTTGDHLNTESYCSVRILYKQRLFTFASSLTSHAKAAPEQVAHNYHTALAHLIQGVPREVLTIDVPQTVSLILECLHVDHTLLVHAVLSTLSSLAQMSQSELTDHISTFVPHCLSLGQSHNSMKVRIAALECVLHFTNYPTILLLPMKDEVVHNTAPCVDDRKRLVRHAAVAARTRWFLVGAPGEPVNR